jgi:Fe-S oxidoreductase
MCGGCDKACPEGVDMEDFFLNSRRLLHKEGLVYPFSMSSGCGIWSTLTVNGVQLCSYAERRRTGVLPGVSAGGFRSGICAVGV